MQKETKKWKWKCHQHEQSALADLVRYYKGFNTYCLITLWPLTCKGGFCNKHILTNKYNYCMSMKPATCHLKILPYPCYMMYLLKYSTNIASVSHNTSTTIVPALTDLEFTPFSKVWPSFLLTWNLVITNK